MKDINKLLKERVIIKQKIEDYNSRKQTLSETEKVILEDMIRRLGIIERELS